MTKKLFILVIALMFIVLGAQTPITIFDFEGDTMEPSLGEGTLVTIGDIGTSFQLGWAGTSQGGRALNTNSYPAQGTLPETAGIRIHVSTESMSNIVLSWNTRNSNTAANRIRLQYTIDGSLWQNFDANESNATNQRIFPAGSVEDLGFDEGMYIYEIGESWFLRSADFTGIESVDDNSNFAIRFVTAFPTGSDVYEASNPGSNYGTAGTIRYDNIVFSFIDESAVMTPVANPLGGTYNSPISVTLTTGTPDARIYFTTNGDEPIESDGNLYTAPIEIRENTTLRFRAFKEGMTPSALVTEEYILPIFINSLAQLRDYPAGTGLLFYVESEVLVTYTQAFRNQIFVQDDTAGILIDDFPGIIQTPYVIGDGIVGLLGTLLNFGGLLQFSPVEDPGPPSSTGHTIIPLVITMSDFINDFDTYESRLVAFEYVNFVSPTGNFAIAQVYPITDETHTIHFRATFEADYLGTPIPTEKFNLIGLLTERTDGRFITARSLDDFRPPTISVDDNPIRLEHRLIGNFPNPFNPSTTISFELKYDTNVNITIFNIRGQRVKTLIHEEREAGSHNIHWNGIDENGNEMASGIYFYRMQTPDFVQVKRAILMK